MKNLTAFVLGASALCAHAQSPITTIPFELYGDHIIVQVTVDDSKPLDFIFDTGSGLTVLDDEVADDLHLVKKSVKLNETKSDWNLIKHNKLEINHFLMEKNIKVYSTDLDHLEISLGLDFDGIVGYDLMRHHSIHINYDRKAIDIYDLGQTPKSGEAVPFTLNTSIPTIEGTVVLNNKEPHDGTFFVMTGAGTTLDFNSPYAEQYDVIHKTGKHYSYLVKGLSDEETPHYEGHVLSFSFGDQVIEDLPIGISAATEGIQADKKVSGILGNQVLSMYNLTIDLPSKVLYMEKNQNFGRKFSVNCSGIDVQLSPDKKKVLIHQVFEDSPAAEAGLQLNDELLKINGKTMDEINLAEVKKLLKKEGETVQLVVNQAGKEKTVSLSLRSLIE